MRRLLAFPDLHARHHDAKAFGAAMNAASGWLRPGDVFLQLGDLVDAEALSAHERGRGASRRFMEDLDAADRLVRLMTDLAPEEKHFTKGNHDGWLDRYLARRAPELEEWKGLSVEEALGFEPRGWRVTPYGQTLYLGELAVSHEFGSAGPQAHQKAVQAEMSWCLMGHTHRAGTFVRRTRTGRVLKGVMSGHLSDVSHVTYRHRSLAMTEWAHAVTWGYLDSDGKVLALEPATISDGKLFLEGRVYRA